MPNYGREHARVISIASLMLMLDVPRERKEKLTIGLIQHGIDLYGTAMAGGYWNEGGGHSSGRKWPVLFAGLMLENKDMWDLPATPFFQEDTQSSFPMSGEEQETGSRKIDNQKASTCTICINEYKKTLELLFFHMPRLFPCLWKKIKSQPKRSGS